MLNSHRIHHARLRVPHEAQRALVQSALPLALQQALDAVAPPDTLWLLRHLPCHIHMAEDAGPEAAVRTLRLSLETALKAADSTAAADSGLLRFDEPVSALLEAFADALGGRRDRGWAWARLGLWPAANPPRGETATVLNLLLQALDRRPLLATWPGADPPPAQRRRALLVLLLSRGLLPRALALLPVVQWAPLAAGLPGAEALHAQLRDALPADPTLPPHVPGPLALAARSTPTPQPAPWPEGHEAAACLAALHSVPLPAGLRQAGAQWLAWLAWLHSDPVGLAAAPQAQVQARLQALAQAALHTQARGRSAAGPRALPHPGAADPRPPAPSTAGNGPATAAATAWRTANAGLLHLLPLLRQLPPLPQASASSQAAASGGAGGLSRERLLRLAVHGLAVPAADPVLAVWLGAASPAPWPPSAPDAQTAVDRAALCAAVQATLRRHLPAAALAELGPDPLPWLQQRGATLRFEAGGWVAQFDEADTRLRRCGLDRDPGLLPWLGLTVVLRYE